jgi:ABC-2 type transport system permease protein
MTALRIFFIGGGISYRALFNWISPWHYIPTMLGGTLFVLIFFTYLGRFTEVQDEDFFVVGNAVYISSISCVYGSIMAIANERYYGTLSPVLATPANRLALFAGRALPYIGNGLLVSAFGFAMGWLLLDFDPPLSSLGPLALVVAAGVVSCTAFGMFLGSIGLRVRDVFFIGNLAYYVLLLFTGANVPLDVLPGWMQTVAQGLPLTHAIEAAREVVAGASFRSVAGLTGQELLVGACYGVAAYTLFRLFEAEARRRATLERI